MKYIEYETRSGAENMALDEKLLNDSINNNIKEPIFRLYSWAPACISVGRNQSVDFLNKNILEKNNINIVKRLTGGRALLHDKELTYSYITPIELLKNGQNVIESYKEISQLLINVLSSLNINITFGTNTPSTKFDYCMSVSTGADLVFEGKKLIGSAQCRKEGYILQHGSILFDYDKELIQELFNEKLDTSSITSIKEINPNLALEELINAFKTLLI